MNDKQLKPKDYSFAEAHRWELAEFYLKRSENSANILRALLFALAVGAIGFIVKELWVPREIDAHAASIIAFAVSVGLIVNSWRIQKSKSIDRFNTIRDKGIEGYFSLEEFHLKKRRNYFIDNWAMFSIFLGFTIEFVALTWKF